MPRPLFGKIVSGLLQANLTTSAALDAIQHLIHTWALRQPAQLTGKELLQRLAAPLSPPLKSGMNILRNITDQQVRHAYIMLSLALPGKAAATPLRVTACPVAKRVPPFGAGLGWRSINVLAGQIWAFCAQKGIRWHLYRGALRPVLPRWGTRG
jgi:hypothetical protein